jgi:hypothetical protein
MFGKFKVLTTYPLLVFFIFGCQQHSPEMCSEYHYLKPDYDSVNLIQIADTVNFPLTEDVYRDIKSFNLFYKGNIPLISFYDQRSQSINIYDLSNQLLYKKIKLKKIFKKETLYKTSVFVKNLDSIFITNETKIGLYNTSGKQISRVNFLDDPKYAWAVFDSNKPLFLKNGKAYAIVRPNVDDQSLSALKKWKVLYEFDFENKRCQLYYHLPGIYQDNLYGYHFLDYNYCYNNKGNIVFSFPADTVIYETNLSDLYRSYYACSQFQREKILPVSKEALINKNGTKEYAKRYSYGSVFFDPIRKYYLRFVKHKLTDADLLAKKRRMQTVLIFNQEFKIIGESEWNDGIDFDSLFFTADGRLYARTNFKDDYALHFVRLDYKFNNPSSPAELSKR